ncbi:hypothetical protein [Actinoplanes sp. NPDC048796]|uniref:hypothetical protein n=1 Tax=Actinoplanes sp. NPDC048796 TaxID=3155640 RepID=UPI0033DB0979
MIDRTNRPGQIVITQPANIGPALGEIREILGFSRHELSRRIAATTGRKPNTAYVQLWNWESGRHAPDVASVALVLKELGLGLALYPLEDA